MYAIISSIHQVHVKMLSEIAEVNTLTLAVVGCAGQGRSTLINSLLLLDPKSPEAAETGDKGETVTTDMRCYSGIRCGAKITIWDTPPLGDDAHVSSKRVIQELRERPRGEVDLCLFCIAYHLGMWVHDGHRNSIMLLTKVFGKTFWKKTCFIITMVNDMKDPKKFSMLQSNVKRELMQALRDAGVPEDIIRDKQLLPAGIGVEPLQVGDGEYEDWNSNLLLHCICTVANERKTHAKRGFFSWLSQ